MQRFGGGRLQFLESEANFKEKRPPRGKAFGFSHAPKLVPGGKYFPQQSDGLGTTNIAFASSQTKNKC